ncbi:MAG: hypothetical protein ACJA2X_002198 [Halocynthiibacter sp.]|jgi:hypothetical protein
MRPMLKPLLLAALAAFFAAIFAPQLARADEGPALRLVMIEEAGCMWCARWNSEIAPIYPKTSEGKAAPLRRIDIQQIGDADIDFKSKPHFTPTFILVQNGVERSRIEGYPGEDFFWGLLGVMIQQAADPPRN